MLFVLAEQMLVFLHILAEFPLQLFSLFLVEDTSAFLLLVHLLEVHLLLNLRDVEHGSDVLDRFHRGSFNNELNILIRSLYKLALGLLVVV